MKKHLIKSILLVLGLCASVASIEAQTVNSITLTECYTKSRENYPMIRQMELIKESKEFVLSNLLKGYLPQFGIYGQASYQSAVTALPIRLEAFSMPPIDKDQYKIYGELNQVIYDGGVIRQQKKTQETGTVIEEQKLEVELYKLKERINQIYFGILLLDQQLELIATLKKDINSGISKTTAAVNNGIALKSSLDVLLAELLKSNQREIELLSARSAYLNMLSLFINIPLNDQTIVEKPQNILVSTEIKRPELNLIDAQVKNLDMQEGILKAKNLPRFNLFVQGGYGRPALNMLDNEFDTYYIGGLRLQWNLSGFYTLHNDKQQVDINRRTAGLQRETFLFNTHMAVIQQTSEISKLQLLLSSDDEIIKLRTNIQSAASAQLENGVSTTSDYLREVNALDIARQNKITHEIQLLVAQYNQQTITGN